MLPAELASSLIQRLHLLGGFVASSIFRIFSRERVGRHFHPSIEDYRMHAINIVIKVSISFQFTTIRA